MAQLHLSPPEPFNFRNPEEWPKWKCRFEQFRIASGLAQEDEKRQVSTLLYCLGEESQAILDSTGVPSEEAMTTYDGIIETFESFFKVRKNVIFERARFNRRNQAPGETSERYIMELYKLAEDCEYGAMKEEMIRDRLVVGIRDTVLSERLQLDPKLTLESAKKAVRQREAVKEQQQTLNKDEQGAGAHVAVDQVRGGKRFSKIKEPRSGREKAKSRNAECSRCGKGHQKHKCPAKEATCHRCNKKGHYSSCCYFKVVGEVSTHSSPNEMELDTVFLDTLISDANEYWKARIEVNGTKLQFKVDTGAEVTAMSEKDYQGLRKVNLQPTSKILYGPSHHILKTIGQFRGKVKYGEKQSEQLIFVVRGLKTNLLGLPAIMALKIAARTDAVIDQKTQLFEKYPSVFTGLGSFGEEYSIKLKDDAKAHALFTPRQVPLQYRSKIQKELERMESLGVISKVDEPTPWCAGMVAVPKRNGSIRICVDLRPLNESVLREVHPLPKIDDLLAQLSGATVFSKLDANSGFWQIPLEKESRLLTTFITPMGRYCFNKLPFGITSAPEHFQKQMSKVLAGLEGALCLIDDILVYAKTQEEHDIRLEAVLKRIQKSGVTLNPEKCEFSKSSLTFLGHVVDKHGVHPDPQKTDAIRSMKPPKDVTELRRFLGMVNQLGKFTPRLAELTHPLRELLGKRNLWRWESPQNVAFSQIKEELSKLTTLVPYNMEAETKVSADSSLYGVGAVLLQKQQQSWRPVAYASRSLSETEKRYAQVEKEALAITWACERFSTYLLGIQFLIETDHKPLISLLGTKQLDNLPPRILRFRIRLTRFNYAIQHVPGKLLYTADTLSRAPQWEETDKNSQDRTESLMEVVISDLPASKQRLAQRADQICQAVIKYWQQGWPQEHQAHFTIGDGLLLYNTRIVVPKSLRKETLVDKIHRGHQGIERCRARARMAVWWPGLSKEIVELVKSCQECTKRFTLKHEPLIPTKLPEYPWQEVGTDLFTFKNSIYLVVVDYFSRYPEIARLTSTTSQGIIMALKKVFARHGIPEFMSLLVYRSTPMSWCGLSPAELCMGRKLRANLPQTIDQLKPQWSYIGNFSRLNEAFKKKQQQEYDRRHKARPLPPIPNNSPVWVNTGTTIIPGRVMKQHGTPRSYIIKTPSGLLRRNRRHLNPSPGLELRNSVTHDDNTDQAPTSGDSDIVEEPLPRPIMTRSRTGTVIHPPERFGNVVSYY